MSCVIVCSRCNNFWGSLVMIFSCLTLIVYASFLSCCRQWNIRDQVYCYELKTDPPSNMWCTVYLSIRSVNWQLFCIVANGHKEKVHTFLQWSPFKSQFLLGHWDRKCTNEPPVIYFVRKLKRILFEDVKLLCSTEIRFMPRTVVYNNVYVYFLRQIDS